MSRESIWVTGAEGKMGAALVYLLKQDLRYKVVGTDTDVDVTDMDAVDQAIDVYRPSVVINCASISNLEACERDMVQAFKVNALGARNLAVASARVNAKLIQLSTDDVFAGKSGARLTEYDNPTPSCVYGKSKLAGENYVRELNPKHVIVRSSWVYGTGRDDYFTYVVDHAKRGEPFHAFMDNVATPTSALSLAKFILAIMDKNEYGIFHASCEGSCSRHRFAKTILQGLGYDENLVIGEYGGDQATCTWLENLMMKMTEVYEMPQWEADLTAYMERYKEREAQN